MNIEELKSAVSGGVYLPGSDAYAAEVAAHNTAIRHTPDVVVAVANADDVAAAVNYAREHAITVSVQSTGHTYASVTRGVFVSTRALKSVNVNPISRTAALGAGVQWGSVIAEAAKYRLAPIAGSSPHVGVVGYLLGGGLGPLARSHGFSSDYVTGFTVVTANGEIVTADDNNHPDLFWALRGGKTGLGIVTEARVDLAQLKTIYAGSLAFDEPHIETVLRKWIQWTHTAHPLVTTSIAIIKYPDIDKVPEAVRGKRALSLRFAFPGDNDFGAQLAEPMRAFAPVLVDALGELPVAQVAQIHNDPTEPAPTWITGLLLDHADDDLATVLLAHFGAGSNSPFWGMEFRHIGSATSSDVLEGSAVAGRSATYAMGAGAGDEKLFDSVMPAIAAELFADLEPWTAREGNPNFAGKPRSYEEFMRTWPAAIRSRLETVRSLYDPSGVFAAFPGE